MQASCPSSSNASSTATDSTSSAGQDSGRQAHHRSPRQRDPATSSATSTSTPSPAGTATSSPASKEPLAPHVLHGAWARARAAHDLDHIHLHDLRHVSGTLAAPTGDGTKELMYRLGHASPQAALRYQHATRDRDLKTSAAIDELIESES